MLVLLVNFLDSNNLIVSIFIKMTHIIKTQHFNIYLWTKIVNYVKMVICSNNVLKDKISLKTVI